MTDSGRLAEPATGAAPHPVAAFRDAVLEPDFQIETPVALAAEPTLTASDQATAAGAINVNPKAAAGDLATRPPHKVPDHTGLAEVNKLGGVLRHQRSCGKRSRYAVYR
jgi:hypothetical protein